MANVCMCVMCLGMLEALIPSSAGETGAEELTRRGSWILIPGETGWGADQMGLLDSQSYLSLLLAVILTKNLKSICPLARLEERKEWFVCSS